MFTLILGYVSQPNGFLEAVDDLKDESAIRAHVALRLLSEPERFGGVQASRLAKIIVDPATHFNETAIRAYCVVRQLSVCLYTYSRDEDNASFGVERLFGADGSVRDTHRMEYVRHNESFWERLHPTPADYYVRFRTPLTYDMLREENHTPKERKALRKGKWRIKRACGCSVSSTNKITKHWYDDVATSLAICERRMTKAFEAV